MKVGANIISAVIGASLSLIGIGLWRHDFNLIGPGVIILVLASVGRASVYSLEKE